jgi:hypothetical protein
MIQYKIEGKVVRKDAKVKTQGGVLELKGEGTRHQVPTTSTINVIMTWEGKDVDSKGRCSSHVVDSHHTNPPCLHFRKIQCPSAKYACVKIVSGRLRSFCWVVLALGFMGVVLAQREIMSPE